MRMKKILSLSAVLTAVVAAANAASFTAGDLVVLRVGDGSSTLANSAGPVSFLELNSLGATVQSVSVPSGSGGLQVSGTATSEGQIVLSADGSAVSFTGYIPPYTGSGSLSGRTAAQAPRGYATLGYDGTVSAVGSTHGAYSGQNIRSGFVSGSTAWFAGSGTGAGAGLVYDNGSSAASIQGVNSRVLGYRNGDLYYSTGSGTTGIYKYSGLPTAATTSSAFLTGIAGQGTSPYDFIFSPDGNSLYVADDGIGVQKFSFNGSVWTLAYNFTSSASANKAFGLAVDFGGTDAVVYWSTPTDIWKATDLGAAAAGTSIATAGANYAFRGLEMAPTQVPEPTALSLAGIGLAVLAFRQRVVARR